MWFSVNLTRSAAPFLAPNLPIPGVQATLLNLDSDGRVAGSAAVGGLGPLGDAAEALYGWVARGAAVAPPSMVDH